MSGNKGVKGWEFIWRRWPFEDNSEHFRGHCFTTVLLSVGIFFLLDHIKSRRYGF